MSGETIRTQNTDNGSEGMLSMITQNQINRAMSQKYASDAVEFNAGLETIYEGALENWIRNGKRGPEPNPPFYQSTDPEDWYEMYSTGASGYVTPDGIIQIPNGDPVAAISNPALHHASRSQPSTLRRVLGGIAGAAVGVIDPRLGGTLSAAITGESADSLISDMHAANMEAIRMQILVNQQSRQFEMTSNILKAQHDAEMNAIRNLK